MAMTQVRQAPTTIPRSQNAVQSKPPRSQDTVQTQPPRSQDTEVHSDKPQSQDAEAIDHNMLVDDMQCPEDVPEGHELTHFPKHPRCPACTRSKIQRTPHRRTSAEVKQEKQSKAVKRFGELITAGHIILGSAAEFSRHGDTVSLVVQDFWTQWIASYPDAVKSAAATKQAMNLFTTPTDKVLRLYSDNSLEIAALELGWRHDSCTPNRPQSNGSAERAVRRVLDGTRTILYRSGLPHSWWAEATQGCCYLRNITDVVRDDKTPYQLRHEEPFPGYRIPFGSVVEYLPSSAREKDARLKFAQRTREGICIGYSCVSGGLWNRDYNILDLETFSRTPAHNPHLALRVREVIIPPKRRFPARCGELIPSAQRDREKLNKGLSHPLGNAVDTRVPT